MKYCRRSCRFFCLVWLLVDYLWLFLILRAIRYFILMSNLWPLFLWSVYRRKTRLENWDCSTLSLPAGWITWASKPDRKARPVKILRPVRWATGAAAAAGGNRPAGRNPDAILQPTTATTTASIRDSTIRAVKPASIRPSLCHPSARPEANATNRRISIITRTWTARATDCSARPSPSLRPTTGPPRWATTACRQRVRSWWIPIRTTSEIPTTTAIQQVKRYPFNWALFILWSEIPVSYNSYRKPVEFDLITSNSKLVNRSSKSSFQFPLSIIEAFTLIGIEILDYWYCTILPSPHQRRKGGIQSPS